MPHASAEGKSFVNKVIKEHFGCFSDNFERFNLISETLQNSTSEKVKKYIYFLVNLSTYTNNFPLSVNESSLCSLC